MNSYIFVGFECLSNHWVAATDNYSEELSELYKVYLLHFPQSDFFSECYSSAYVNDGRKQGEEERELIKITTTTATTLPLLDRYDEGEIQVAI